MAGCLFIKNLNHFNLKNSCCKKNKFWRAIGFLSDICTSASSMHKADKQLATERNIPRLPLLGTFLVGV